VQLHKDSHIDHVNATQLEYIMQRFARRDGFFIETFELPEPLGTVSCGLYGPTMGDAPIADRNVDTGAGDAFYRARSGREWESRMVSRPMRPTNKLTIVAGPHDSYGCVLYTVYGGPPAPQEPDDPCCADPEASRVFWAEHALSDETPR